MTESYRVWSGPARTMAVAVDAAVSAARSGDADAFAAAKADLARVDREQLAVLLGTVTRELLERAHPDGLDSDDAELLVQGCLRSAADWYPPLDRDCVVWALTGAVGVNDPDEAPDLNGPPVVAHGLLLIADLLTGLAQDLPPVLNDALGELQRAQTVELP